MQILRTHQLSGCKCFVRGHKRETTQKYWGLPDALDGILQHFFAEINKKDGKTHEVQLTDTYVSQIMGVLYWTLDFPKELEMC